MQIAALPTDPKMATEKLGQTSAVPRIMKLKEKERKSKATDVLAEFEAWLKQERDNYEGHYWKNGMTIKTNLNKRILEKGNCVNND